MAAAMAVDGAAAPPAPPPPAPPPTQKVAVARHHHNASLMGAPATLPYPHLPAEPPRQPRADWTAPDAWFAAEPAKRKTAATEKSGDKEAKLPRHPLLTDPRLLRWRAVTLTPQAGNRRRAHYFDMTTLINNYNWARFGRARGKKAGGGAKDDDDDEEKDDDDDEEKDDDDNEEEEEVEAGGEATGAAKKGGFTRLEHLPSIRILKDMIAKQKPNQSEEATLREAYELRMDHSLHVLRTITAKKKDVVPPGNPKRPKRFSHLEDDGVTVHYVFRFLDPVTLADLPSTDPTAAEKREVRGANIEAAKAAKRAAAEEAKAEAAAARAAKKRRDNPDKSAEPEGGGREGASSQTTASSKTTGARKRPAEGDDGGASERQAASKVARAAAAAEKQRLEEEEAAVRAGTIPWSLHLPPKAAETMVGVRQRLADASAARARAQEEAAAAAAMMALQGAPPPNDAPPPPLLPPQRTKRGPRNLIKQRYVPPPEPDGAPHRPPANLRNARGERKSETRKEWCARADAGPVRERWTTQGDRKAMAAEGQWPKGQVAPHPIPIPTYVADLQADPATAVPDSAVGAADLGIGIKAGIATTDGGRLLLGNKEYRVLSGASATQAEYARLATAPGAPPPLVLSLREATATGVVRAIDERLRTLLARQRWYGTKRLRNRAFTNRVRTDRAAAEYAARAAGATPYRPCFEELGKAKQRQRVRRMEAYEALNRVPAGTAQALRNKLAAPAARQPRNTTTLAARGARPTIMAVGDADFATSMRGGPPGGRDAFLRALVALYCVIVVFIDERCSSSDCVVCGDHVDAPPRMRAWRVRLCPTCGILWHREHNSAIHILLRLFAQPALFRLALQQLRARVEYFTSLARAKPNPRAQLQPPAASSSTA